MGTAEDPGKRQPAAPFLFFSCCGESNNEVIQISVIVCCTFARSDQPAVQEASCQRIVEDHGLLTADRLQDVFHGNWDIRVRGARLLTSFLPFNQEICKGTCSPSLSDGQRLIVAT